MEEVVTGYREAVAGAWPTPAARAPGADGVGDEPLADLSDEDSPDTTLDQGRRALAVIEAGEVAKSFVDAVSVEAAGVVTTAYELHLDPATGVDLGMARRAQLALAGRDGAAAEIQAATGMSATCARRLVRFARAGGARTGTTRTLLGQGRLSLHRAYTLLERTADLAPEVADQVAADVLRPLPGHPGAGGHGAGCHGAGCHGAGCHGAGGHGDQHGPFAPDPVDNQPSDDHPPGDYSFGADTGGPQPDPGGHSGSGTVPTCGGAPESGHGCVPISSSTFYRRLKVARTRHGAQDEHRDREVRDRRAGFELAENGTASLWVTGDGPRTVAAHRRIDTMARAARRAGDDRTLDQLRSDIILDLLLYGVVPTDLVDDPGSDAVAVDRPGAPAGGQPCAPAGGREGSGADGRPGGLRNDGQRVPFAVDESPAPGARQRRTQQLIGTPPPAVVHVVVSLDTLVGTADGLGELPGYGFLTAAQTREVCLAAGSTWRRLVTDPASGHLVELSGTTYQPPRRLAAQVDARDHTCRGPGCTVPAENCDLDHGVDHADGGGTSTGNLSAKHRRCHNLKTRRLWHTRQQQDGTITWTTLLGRSYTTEPHDYRELSERDASPPNGTHVDGTHVDGAQPAGTTGGTSSRGGTQEGSAEHDADGEPPF